MKCIRWFVALGVVLGVVACAPAYGPLPQEDLTASKRLAVVSFLGDDLQMVRVGTTVFGNADYAVPVAEWGVNSMAESAMVDRINQSGGRKAEPLVRDGKLNARVQAGQLFRPGADYEQLFELARKQGADTLVMVQSASSQNQPLFKPGYGMYERTFFGSTTRCPYAMFIVSALPVVEGTYGKQGRYGAFQWSVPCLSGRTEIAWKESFSLYSPDEVRTIQTQVEKEVRQNLTRALGELGF